MSLAFRQIKVYVKLCSLIAALLVAVVVIVKNLGESVRVWFFGWHESVNIGLLVTCTAAITLVGWWVLRPAMTVHRDLGDLRRNQMERDQQKRQAELLDRLEKAPADKPASPLSPPPSEGDPGGPDLPD